jgi:hypothetical protein
MKYLCLLVVIYSIFGCGNKKAEIVEELKKAKNDFTQAEMNRSAYSSAANRLQSYHSMLESSRKYHSKQMEKDALVYKEGYEREIKNLKGVPNEVLNDGKKLDSVALVWEWKGKDAKRKIDSLEMELKKY